MARLFWLSDEAWAAIDPHLPRGKPGKPRVDDRRVIQRYPARGATCRPSMARQPLSTIATTGGRGVGCGSVCLSRSRPVARFPRNSAWTARM
jgi:hypothetical protein